MKTSYQVRISSRVIVAFFSLCLAGTMAQAQTTSHKIPYNGYLDLNGEPQTGEFDFKLEIQAEDSSPLWSGEALAVKVSAGRFFLVLGEGTAENPLLGDAVWQTDELFLAIQVKASSDSSYSLLSGRQRILAVPYAARSETAKNYRVTGTLEVDGAATAATLEVDGAATAATFNGKTLEDTGLYCYVESELGDEDATANCPANYTRTGCTCFVSGDDSKRCNGIANSTNGCYVDGCGLAGSCQVQAFCCRVK